MQNAQSTMDSERRLRQIRNEEEWERSQKEMEEKQKFWEANETIPFTEEEVSKKLSRIVPTRFEKANRAQIDEKIWKLTAPFFSDEGLYIYGKPGTGKTHLCAAMIREFYSRFPKQRQWLGDDHRHAEYVPPPDPRLITVPDLFMKIKASFGKKEAEADHWDSHISEKEMNESQLIQKFSTLDVLFLDDIGTEKTTDWAQQTLYSIIDYRYREMLQTVITSNLSLNELSDKTGDRITSRIAEMCRVIELKGKDRRLGGK